jgi:hypothetical protein
MQQDNPFIEPAEKHTVIDLKGDERIKPKNKTVFEM